MHLTQTNVDLVQKLVDALEVTQSKAHVLFSSSTQEERDNEYGKSKERDVKHCIIGLIETGGNLLA